MSYKAQDIELVVKGVKALLPIVFTPKWRNNDGILKVAKAGFIFPGKLVEAGLIEKSKGNLKSLISKTRTEDYDDYSDAKYLSVGFQDPKYNPKRYAARLIWEGLKNKKGALRVVVYERIQNQLFYFYFPRRFWKQWKNLEIPFDVNGDPKDSNKFWAYEVDSFKELARIKKEDWINVR